MKKRRGILLLFIYIVIFIFTIIMEYVSITNMQMRMLVNVCTLCMTVISAAMCWLIYRSGQQKEKNKSEVHENNGVRDRDTLLNEKNDTGGTGSVEDSTSEIQGKMLISEEPPVPIFDKQKYLQFAENYQLTRRETEIGLLILNGYSNQQIAEQLYIAETTVKKHVSHIYEKTGVSGRKEFKRIVQQQNTL